VASIFDPILAKKERWERSYLQVGGFIGKRPYVNFHKVDMVLVAKLMKDRFHHLAGRAMVGGVHKNSHIPSLLSETIEAKKSAALFLTLLTYGIYSGSSKRLSVYVPSPSLLKAAQNIDQSAATNLAHIYFVK